MPEPQPEVADDDLGSLDFTLPGVLGEPGGKHTIEVQEATHQIPPAVEQAAMLYSSNQAAEAFAVLEAAVKGGEDLGNYGRRAWGMLFDLLQMLGRREAFEALGLEFAAKFETSPPPWAAAGAAEGGANAAQPAGTRAYISLSGVLSAKAQEPLKQLVKNAEKNPVVRLDVSKVTDAAEEGCALLHGTLLALKKAKKECVLGGAERLASVLAKKIVPGQRENERTWLLLLELYQQLFQQQAFEDAAVNYAVTFEVSPPSWEAPKAKRSAPIAEIEAATAAMAEAAEGYDLEGDIVAAGGEVFAPLQSYAEGREDVAVNCRELMHMDFVSAGQLLNVVANLSAAGKRIRFRGVSHLLAALWEVLGLDRVATVETRKL